MSGAGISSVQSSAKKIYQGIAATALSDKHREGQPSKMSIQIVSKRRAACIALLLLACVSRCFAQEPTPTPTPTPTPSPYSRQTLVELKQLQQAALTSDYAYRQVAHLSNNIGPRLTGSAQAQKAVEYVASELKAIGCEVQLEKVMVPHWVRGEETAALVQWPGMAEKTTQKIVLCALGG